MKRKMILAVAAIAFVASACGVGKLKEDGHAFMESLKAGDATKSYGLLHEALQKKVGGAEGWATMAAEMKPVKWNFSGFNVNANGESKLDGDVEYADGKKSDLGLEFMKVGDTNKVLGFSFKKQ